MQTASDPKTPDLEVFKQPYQMGQAQSVTVFPSAKSDDE